MIRSISLPRRALLASAAGLTMMPRARAQAPILRIGVLTDLSGPYRDNGGLTAVACGCAGAASTAGSGGRPAPAADRGLSGGSPPVGFSSLTGSTVRRVCEGLGKAL